MHLTCSRKWGRSLGQSLTITLSLCIVSIIFLTDGASETLFYIVSSSLDILFLALFPLFLFLYNFILQIEPILSGNLPPGFDSSTCRSVYVGNVHPQVTDPLLQEVFSSTGPIEGCKLIRKEKSSYGFVDYFDRRSAALAIVTLNGRHLFGQPIKVNWAYASNQREDTSGHFNIFVGDLSPEVTDATLFACFSVYPSCSDARVMWDQKTGRSRGFGFVSFRTQQDAQTAVNDLNGENSFIVSSLSILLLKFILRYSVSNASTERGKWLGSRQIRCNWATKGAGVNDDNHNLDGKSVVELTNGSSEDGQERTNEDAPENNPQYTTVYVGNLAPEISSADLHQHFHLLGAGVIEDVRIQRDKGFGFIRYSTHAEAARAIQMGNARIFFGKPIKIPEFDSITCYGPESIVIGYAAYAYAHAYALAPGAANPLHQGPALLLCHRQLPHSCQPQAQQRFGAAGASQAIYDGGYPGIASSQPSIYYQ
ncbi:hypothetical protein RHSIM_Rhsim03G0226600 [Rhododendron simsii]|uniref:RRM domain-containing protein n=1 Tax=Rhododendron simsii TaxID=118357 RepID=A0A834LVE0_RHOSS|nr:hypothetical protein RHSIM_Rhsim03G0226600 [Rhododendron simsii]